MKAAAMVGLEICVDTIAGLRAAIDGGADRIELCSALPVGGLSPSRALLEAARKSPVPVYVMVRPRAGDFLFSGEELGGMLVEIAQVRELGLAGVVLGAGSEAGLDFAVLEKLTAAAAGLGKTLHRVVDLLPERKSVLEPVHALGFERILSSGGKRTAMEGLDDLRRLAEAAPKGLSIMPGSGVTPDNAARIISATGATEIHGSASVQDKVPAPRLAELGFSTANPKHPTAESVRRLKNACATLSTHQETE